MTLESQRKLFVYENEEWREGQLGELTEGDIFRMTEHDDTPLPGQTPETCMVATGRASVDCVVVSSLEAALAKR